MARNKFYDFDDPESQTNLKDDEYLQVAANAAVEDRLSGAFDEFHFSEEKISATPFEIAVDSFTDLKSKRLRVRQTRELNKLNDRVVRSRNVLENQQIKRNKLEKSVEDDRQKIESELAILSGERTGNEGLFWEAPPPVTNSRLSARFSVLQPVIVMLVAGLVDITIIAYTYFELFPGSEEEAWLFTIPAVAIQVAFPHFMGTRLAQLIRMSTRRALLWSQFAILFLGWALFVAALVMIRVQSFTTSESAQYLIDSGTFEWALVAFGIASVMMLVGLGVWLIMAAMHDNPHVRFFLRYWLHLKRSEQDLEKITVSTEVQKSEIEIAENILETARSAFEDAITAYRFELAVAAKDVYRRSFINSFGQPGFTATFMTRSESRNGKSRPTNGGE